MFVLVEIEDYIKCFEESVKSGNDRIDILVEHAISENYTRDEFISFVVTNRFDNEYLIKYIKEQLNREKTK